MTLQYDIVDIYDLLYRLGLKATNTAFFYTSYAVYLAAQQPDRLLKEPKSSVVCVELPVLWIMWYTKMECGIIQRWIISRQ